jgi:hypothetical protein
VTKTVEERILELQEKKRLLAEQTIEGVGAGGGAAGGANKNAMKLGLNDIIDLFRPTATAMYGQGSTAGDGVEGVDERGAANPRRRVGGGMASGGVRREESATYGRRW